MAQFDPNEYFARRQSMFGQSKLDELATASTEKMGQLQAYREREAVDAPLRAAVYDKTWVGKTGLEPTSILGGTVKAAANFAEGGVIVAKNFMAGARDAQLGFDTATGLRIPEPVNAAFARYRQGNAEPGDLQLLQADPQGGMRKGMLDRTKSFMDTLNARQSMIDDASAIRKAMDVSSIVDQGSKDGLTNDLKKGFQPNAEQVAQGWDSLQNGKPISGAADVVAGLAGAIANIGVAAVNNKQGAAEYLASNIPQILLAAAGSAGMAITNIPYAISAFGDGIAAYQKANNGEIPPNAEMLVMAGKAATLAVAETVGDKITLGAGRLTQVAAQDAAKTSFKKALGIVTNNPLTRTAGAVLAGGSGEFATEAYQTYVEDSIKGKQSSVEDVYVGGAIGAIVGGGVSGGMHTVAETTKSLPEQVAAKKEQVVRKAERDATMQAAIETGDTAAYTDPASSQFAPEKAISALFGNSQKAGTSTEAKQENIVKGAQIVSDLEAEVTAINAVIQGGKPSDVVKSESVLARMQAALANTDPVDTARVAQLTAAVSTLQEQIVEGSTPEMLASAVVAAKTALPKLQEQLTKAQTYQEELVGVAKVAATADQVASHTADIEAVTGTNDTVEVTTKAVASATALINLSMASSSNLSPKVAASLASNMNNALTTPQREYLRAFSAARLSENAVMSSSTVDQEIFVGNTVKKQRGIVYWRDSISNAVTLGDSKSANASLAKLNSFAVDHSDKFDAATNAMQESKDSNQIKQILRVKKTDGTPDSWEIPAVNIDPAEKTKNGGLDIQYAPGKGNSASLIARMGAASAALKDAVAEQSAIIAIRFPAKVVPVAAKPAVQAVNVPAPSTQVSVAPTVNAKRAASGSLIVPTEAGNSYDPVVAYAATQKQVSAAQVGKALKIGSARAGNMLRIAQQEGVVSAPDKNGVRTVLAATSLATVQSGIPAAPTQNSSNDKKTGKVEVRVPITNVIVPVAQVKTNPTLSTDAFVKLLDTADTYTNWSNHRDGSDRQSLTDQIRSVAKTYQPLLTDSNSTEVITELNGFKWFKSLSPEAKQAAVLALASGKTKTTEATSAQVKFLTPGDFAISAGWRVHSMMGNAFIASMKNTDGTIRRISLDPATGKLTSDVTTQAKPIPASPTGKQEASEQQAATPVETVAAKDATDQADPVHPEGILRVFGQKLRSIVGSMHDNFQSMNLVAQFMVQDKDNPLLLTQRPLAIQKNFLSSWVKDATLVHGFVENGKDLSEGQESALDDLKKNLVKWGGMFKENFALASTDPKHAAFKQRDMMQYFLETNEDGSLDVEENVSTAMAYAVYHWTLSKANSPALLTVDQINKMHGQSKGAIISKEGIVALSTLAGFESMIISELGEVAFQALGLRAAKDAPVDLVPRMKSALGSHAMLLLEKEGIIRRKSVLATTVNDYFENGSKDWNNEDTNESNESDSGPTPDSKATYDYVELVREAKGFKLNPAAAMIRAANVKSKSVVEKLFGVDRAPRIADTKPAPFMQKLAKNSRMAITAMQAAVMDTIQQIPHTLIPEMDQIAGLLGRDTILTIAGKIDLESGKQHISNRAAIEAQNQNLENQYDIQEDMLNDTTAEEGRYAPRYVLRSVWKNFRAGYSTQSLNQQTSKIHRYMFSRPNWEATINLNDHAMVDEFLISVAMNLGMKTDSQRNETTQKMFAAELENNPEIMKATQLIQKHASGLPDADGVFPDPMTTAEIETIQNVAVNAEGMASLQALVAYAKYQDALVAYAADSSKAEFKVVLLVGADGKTSGPMLTHLALGAAGNIKDMFVLLNRGGFYSTEEGQAKHFSEYAERAGSNDLYKDLGSQILTEANSRVVSPEIAGELRKKLSMAKYGTPQYTKASADVRNYFTQAQFNAVQAVTGDLLNKAKQVTSAGRNLVKTPLTAFMFGSSLNTSISGMTDAFIESVYKVFEGMAQGNRKPGGLSLEAYLKQLQVMLDMGSTAKFPAGQLSQKFLTEPLETELTPNQVKALRKAFGQVIGNSAKDTMGTYFAVFSERRNVLNASLQAGYYVYEAAYAAARTQEFNRLMEAGDVAYRLENKTAKKIPLHDLTVDQDNNLREKLKSIEPVSHSAFSAQDGNLDAGIFMAKTTNGTSDSPFHENIVNVAEGMAFTNNAGKPDKSFKLHSKSTVQTPVDVGVAGTPYGIHSADAAGMFNGVAKVPAAQAMDVHDEAASGVQDIASVAAAVNESILETMLAFSPTREALNMLERQAVGMVRLMKSGAMPKSSVRAALASWSEIYAKLIKEDTFPIQDAADAMMRLATNNAFQADTLRLQAISQMGSVDQYTWEGGQFTVTDAIRADALKQLEALSAEPTQAFMDAVVYMNIALQAQQKTEAEVYENWVGLNTYKENNPSEKVGVINRTTRLAKHAVVLKSLVETLRDQLPKALLPLLKGKQSVVDSINTLKQDDRVQAIQVLATAFSKIASSSITPYGERGDSGFAHDKVMVAAFEKNPVMGKTELLALLQSRLTINDSGMDETLFGISGVIFRQIAALVPNDLVVRYITPSTSQFDVLQSPVGNSRGWFVMDPEGNSGKGATETYILSTDHKNSGVNAELVLHELIHTVVAKLIAQEQANAAADKKYTSPALDLVKELEALRKVAQKYVKDSKLGSTYDASLGDVHELVSWGMSNRDFQENVLRNVQMASTTTDNSLVTGMVNFIRSVVGIIFKNKSPRVLAKLSSGMEILVQNASGLFAAMAEETNRTSVINRVINQSQASPNPNDYTTLDLFDSIVPTPGQVEIGTAFSEQLRGVLSDITHKINDKIGSLKESLMQQQTLSPADTYAKAIADGDLNFSVKSRRSNASIREQEAFVMDQVEAVVRAAIGERDGSGTASVAYTELVKLYKETRTRLSPADFFNGVWANRTPSEEREATELHDFIFKMEKTNGDYSDYLSRFAAFGLAHEGFNKLLNVATQQDAQPVASTLLQRLKNLVSSMMEYLGGMVTNTRGVQRANAKLEILVNQLVRIEAKKRTKLALLQQQKSLFTTDPALTLIATTKAKLDDFGKTPFFRDSKNVYMQAGGTLLSTWAGDRTDLMMEAITKIRNKNFKDAPGALMHILNDVKGSAWSFGQSLLLAKDSERERLHIKKQFALKARQAFSNGGRDLTLPMQAAVSYVLLRTGAHVLIDQFNVVEIEQLLADKSALAAAIKKHEGDLKGTTIQQAYFKEQAKTLGYFKVTGDATNEGVLLNAGNIARMYDRTDAKIAEGDVAAVTKTVDTLATLYAFEYGDSVHTSAALKIFKTENARTDGNGVLSLLYLHRLLDQQAKERLFGTNEALMVKGFTSEIYNPHIDLKMEYVANGGQDLIDAGYQEGAMVPNDSADPDQEQKRMYINPIGGLTAYLSGIFSLKGIKAKGSTGHNNNDNLFTADGQKNLSTIQAIQAAKQAGIQAIGTNPNFDPRNVRTTHMVAVRNSAGEAVDYRYMMRESTKDNLLERNNSFSEILGTMASTTYDKENSVEQNRKAVQLNFDQYNEDYAKNADAYIRVGAYSTDPEMREIYRLLPDSTKDTIKKIWGKEGMMIRNDLLDINFGYRKLSLASIWDIDPDSRNAAEKVVVTITERVLSTYGTVMGLRSPAKAKEFANYEKRAANIVRRNGRIWQEIVKEAKDFIVIKSGVVTFGNATANASLLAMEGIGPKEQAVSGYVGFKGITAYQRDTAALYQLQLQRDSGYVVGDPVELNREVTRLENEIARNPVRVLVEAGLMPTIVEDLGNAENEFSYKTKFAKTIDSAVSKLNPTVVAAGKALYMPHTSSVYKVLNRTAQLSDFLARYTMYEHLTTRKVNPLSTQDALQQAAESFIMYDTPMHRGLQYTDDMGITMFTKYFIRIQRILYRLAKEHPTRFVGAMLLNHFMHIVPTVLDSSALNHLGNNPFRSGALQFPSAVGSSAYVSSAVALFK